MPVDFGTDLLRLSIVQMELRKIKTNLVRGIAATGNRSLALLVKQNLTSAENFIRYATDPLQPRKEDNSGIPEREALQL